MNFGEEGFRLQVFQFVLFALMFEKNYVAKNDFVGAAPEAPGAISQANAPRRSVSTRKAA